MNEWLKANNTMGMEGVDTRRLARHIRINGSMRACVSTELTAEEAVARAKTATKLDGAALALITDSKYGYRANGDHFGVSLINTSTNPDPYPERGQHIVNLALAISQDDAKILENTASQFNHCTHAISNNSHPGTLPMGMSFLEFKAESSVVSSVLPTEKSGTIRVRFYETCGKDDTVVLTLAKAPINAVSVDLAGKEVPSDITVCGNEVRVSVKSHCIGEVELKF